MLHLSSDEVFLYLLLALQVACLIYGWTHIYQHFFTSKYQKNHTIGAKKSVKVKILICAFLTRWTLCTLDLFQNQKNFTEWDPYKILHIKNDGKFNSFEMRQSYHKLKNIYHPDKVDKVKLAGKEAQVLQRWDNLQLAFKTLTD